MDNADFLEKILESMTQGIYIVNRAGDYIYCNSAFQKMVNANSKENILKLNAFRLVPEGQVSRSATVEAFTSRKRTSMINNVTTPEGFHYRQMLTATPLLDDAGEVEYVLAETMRTDLLTENYQEALFYENEDDKSFTREYAVEQTDAIKQDNGEEIISESLPMKQVIDLAKQIAPVDSAVLINGETGTGKEVVTHYIHANSSRSQNPLIEINCAALPENLMEAELFGYEKGAFTGASSSGKVGMIEEADGGTLFLDEINSLPLSLQGKLLQVLETHRSKRIGAVRDKAIDFRLIAATNEDLEECVKAGTFRPDLYYRLNVIPITVPPLRERKEDIIPLSLHFLKIYCQKYECEKVFSFEVLKRMTAYSWPGNVRELKNIVERMVITGKEDGEIEITKLPSYFPEERQGEKPAEAKQPETNSDPIQTRSQTNLFTQETDPHNLNLKQNMENFEKNLISAALTTQGSTYKAARALGVDQSTVVRKKQKYGL